ncbi:MAG TPA: hypothetical protein VMJ32_01570 [Pirellulales bacterium]|nr:hypothetical protein [Pirellulales bacterium]
MTASSIIASKKFKHLPEQTPLSPELERWLAEICEGIKSDRADWEQKWGRMYPTTRREWIELIHEATADHHLALEQDITPDDALALIQGYLRRNARQAPVNLNDARDKFCYEKCCDGTTYKEIRRIVNEHQNWEPLGSSNAAKQAAIRYANRNKLPKIPKRQHGRPRAIKPN